MSPHTEEGVQVAWVDGGWDICSHSLPGSKAPPTSCFGSSVPWREAGTASLLICMVWKSRALDLEPHPKPSIFWIRGHSLLTHSSHSLLQFCSPALGPWEELGGSIKCQLWAAGSHFRLKHVLHNHLHARHGIGKLSQSTFFLNGTGEEPKAHERVTHHHTSRSIFKPEYVWLQIQISSLTICASNVEMISLLNSIPSAPPCLHWNSLCVGYEGVSFDSHLSTFQIPNRVFPWTSQSFS